MDAATITTIGAILGSSMMVMAVLLRQMNHLETKLGTRIDDLGTAVTVLSTRVTALDGKVDALDRKVDALDRKVDALDRKVDALDGKVSDVRERTARVEGCLMAGEGFALNPVRPPPEDLDDGRRRAG